MESRNRITHADFYKLCETINAYKAQYEGETIPFSLEQFRVVCGERSLGRDIAMSSLKEAIAATGASVGVPKPQSEVEQLRAELNELRGYVEGMASRVTRLEAEWSS